MPGRPEDVRVTQGAWSHDPAGRKTRTDTLRFTPHTAAPTLAFDLNVTLTLPTPDAVTRKRQVSPAYDAHGYPSVVYVGGKRHESILDNGYAVLNYPNDTIEPMEMGKPRLGPARQAYSDLTDSEQYSWGSIATWAWGAIRVLDYAVTIPELDSDRIAITGHSRNGKTALLAGALDERFAVVNPAGSGCAGAGSYLALGEGCEDLAALTSRDRWWAWTHPDFENWVGREHDLPFDQHFLMSLIAPRPLLRTEGIDDHWANPTGTSVSYIATQPVYDFLGVPDLNTIHYRAGGHDHTEEDAAALMALCDETFFDQPRSMNVSQPLDGTPKLEEIATWDRPAATA